MVTPFAFGMPTFDIVMVLTMALVMIVVMIESVGMFLALSDLTGKRITPASSPPACAPTVLAPSSAASSTPSPTPVSRRTSAWSASPA